VIAGASGLVGGCLPPLLHEHYDAVLSLGRRTFAREHPRLRQAVVDFAALTAGRGRRPGRHVCPHPEILRLAASL
jgi:NAD dependent epimerase/dehydratase family enzyme